MFKEYLESVSKVKNLDLTKILALSDKKIQLKQITEFINLKMDEAYASGYSDGEAAASFSEYGGPGESDPHKYDKRYKKLIKD
jgi:hypothetical protein